MPNTASKTGSKCSLSSLNSAVSPVSCALGVFSCLGCLDNNFQWPAKPLFYWFSSNSVTADRSH
ncbi:hypothetical protein C4K68_21230 [Pokkaliibacter plantistimulans]|uniref:Uncharacterized protein n=1 Tax=Proteobacteria bacterium 228 TaxID=2083153 RepID=A0A2S5KJZ9_9PROT|nr:hypothetical protein C4K68_21230 [Pokkaliibacter plantistimulans]